MMSTKEQNQGPSLSRSQWFRRKRNQLLQSRVTYEDRSMFFSLSSLTNSLGELLAVFDGSLIEYSKEWT